MYCNVYCSQPYALFFFKIYELTISDTILVMNSIYDQWRKQLLNFQLYSVIVTLSLFCNMADARFAILPILKINIHGKIFPSGKHIA